MNRSLPLTIVVACLLLTLNAIAAPPVISHPPAAQTIFLGDPVTFQVEASGTPPLSYQWLRDGSPISGATTSSLTFPTGPADDGAAFSVRVTNLDGVVTSDPAVLTIDFGIPGPAQTNRVLEITDLWRYNVDKVDLGTSWTDPNYDDSGWNSGGGLLYVESSGLPAPKTTELPLTPHQLPTTTYFRTRFTNSFTGSLADTYNLTLVANTVVDDGFVLHLNGAEVYRKRMPAGAIAYGTHSVSPAVGNANWEGPFDLPTTNLLVGENVFAAEVHQINDTSSDIVMGLTLDVVWQPRVRDESAPVVASVAPEVGSTVPTLTQITIEFSEDVQGVDAADLLINDVPATGLLVMGANRYIFQLPQPPDGPVTVSWSPDHGITDRSANFNAFEGGGFGYLIDEVSYASQLSFATVTQSTEVSSGVGPEKAVDGATTTFSLTRDEPGSFWQGQLGRSYPVERIELVNRPTPSDAELGGLVLRLSDIDDQVVYTTELSNPGPSGLLVIDLPTDTTARSLWIGLPGQQTNEAGNYRVGLAEVRLFGLADIPFGPPPVVTTTNSFRVWQSSEYPGFPAGNAVDGDLGNFTHTDDLPDSYWMADLGQLVPIDRVEIVNRSSCCDERMEGLVLRILDGSSNSVASATLPNPGRGGTWTYTPPAGTQGRWIRVGLENGEKNGGGNYYVTLAEARVFSGTTNMLGGSGSSQPVPVTPNLASFKRSYMLRLNESVPPASMANDDNYATQTKGTTRAVDTYWEVDLGATYALYGIRAIAASGISFRLTNTIVRIFDEAHDSVHAQKVTGEPDTFDVDLNGPIFGRYVRVGLEEKTRTDPSGGIEFYIGFREVEVFGRATNEVGVLSFTASKSQVAAGENVTLSWSVEDVSRVEIHPDIGSVGAYTAANGQGSITVPVNASTEFVLVATNAAGVFSHAVSVEVNDAPLPVQLSEVVADNQYSLKDGDNHAPDWIELRNTSDHPVNLAGWGLSDNNLDPTKWTFPDVTIAPHDTLIVFASGNAEPLDAAGNLHANFRLEKNGDSLYLTAGDGVTLVDSVVVPEVDTDLAYGRDLDGAWTFIEPTPGAVNAATTYEGWLKELQWSHRRGFHETSFTLTLTNPNPDSVIFYSLDGSEPTLEFPGSLLINRTRAVRAQARRDGYRPARVQTKTFVFIDDVITSSVMNRSITQNSSYAPRLRQGLLALPSISICLPGQPEYAEKAGSVEILWPNGGNPMQVNCGVKRFGHAWTKFAKRSIRLKFRAEYGAAKLNVPLFNGFDRSVLAKTSFDKLDLRSGSHDMNQRGFYMAGRFVEDSMLDMGSLNPHGRFVHVYINGVYWGQYDCREQLDNHFLADYLGGSPEDYVEVRGNDNVGSDFVIGTPDPPNLDPWEFVRANRSSYETVDPYLDVSHLIDFMLLWNYGNCESEFRCAGPIDPGSGFKFWIADADGFLRTSAMGKNRTSTKGPGGLFGSLRSEGHPDFKTLLADRIYKHFFNDGALTPEANEARLDARMSEIHDSLILECARWGYRTPSNWESAADTIRTKLFPGRTSQLLGYLRNAGLYPATDAPTFNQYGGLVTPGFQPEMTSNEGTIYYTLDGSDPRLPGGGISPSARIWTPGAVTVTGDLTLNVRVRSASGQWSALAQPRYLIAPRRAPTVGDLFVTEINYNPNGSDDFEFVELWNASTNLLDLSGIALSNAVHFVFPSGFALAPGEFTVVVEDTASFSDRYQVDGSPYAFSNINVAGQWTGALANGGERLSVIAADGTELCSVPYEPSGGAWPVQADGNGSSLELAFQPPADATDDEVRAFMEDGRNWRPSSLFHGSPGRFDVFESAVRINEVLSHSDVGDDWIELLNTGNEAVDLSDCTLAEDLDQPAAWAFPANTMLAPGEFLVVTAPELGFAFSELGAEAFLLQWDDGNIVRILDFADIPAAAPQESLGVFERSDGVLDLTELRANTFNAANALPRVGPVVISEIMYQPEPDKAEFVELANITDSPVALYDSVRPTNVWKLSGVGPFLFPPGTVIQPCATLIVCSTDPDTFRAQYGLGPEVAVLGPWPGGLDNDADTLRLLRPGNPEPDGKVPYYRVDHVTYHATAPWAETRDGVSLEKIPVEAYGDDPFYWRPTSLAGTPGVPAPNRPPVVHFSGDTVVAQGSLLTLSLLVADLDSPWQATSLEPMALPEGSHLDPTTGVLTWVPALTQGPGEFVARVAARDDSGCDALQSSLDIPITVVEGLVVNAEFAGGEVTLRFPGTSGATYRVEYTDDLLSGQWRLLREVTVGEGGTVEAVDPLAEPSAARFYRVQWVR